MDLDAQRLNVVGAVGAACEVRQVELDLVPAFVEPHRHRADERLDASGGLVIGSSKPTSHIFIIQDLNFERKVLFQLGLT